MLLLASATGRDNGEGGGEEGREAHGGAGGREFVVDPERGVHGAAMGE